MVRPAVAEGTDRRETILVKQLNRELLVQSLVNLHSVAREVNANLDLPDYFREVRRLCGDLL
jgi:hypothetical protein